VLVTGPAGRHGGPGGHDGVVEPAAVIFDLDGVLVDSEPLWDAVRTGLAASNGRPWPDGATRELQGMSTPEWARYLVDTVGIPGPPEHVAKQVIAAVADRYREHLPLLPGAVRAVRAMARWPLAVASSSPPELIEVVVTTAGLADLFGATVSSEEVPRGKPAPDVYLAAAQRLGADPAGCLAVEDSANGLRSAATAGMTVVAAPNPGYPPAADALALAAVRLDHLDDLTPDLVASL
jgi:HAD superfamily hydrolase (TIGR01509 family)